MPLAENILLAVAAFLGHFALAVWLYNRLHAIALPVRVMKWLERSLLAVAAAVLFAWIVRSAWLGRFVGDWSLTDPWTVYSLTCWAVAALIVPLWLTPKLLERAPAALLSNDTDVIDVESKLGELPIDGGEARWLAAIPGNQICRLHVHRKTIRLTRLPRQLDGLSIAHLSDLHMIGNMTEPFYQQVVEATNSLAPDLVCITGDILEKTCCLPWIATTLGRLNSRYGKFFVVGNHEMRLPDVGCLREALRAAGFSDLGSRCETLTIRGTEVLLAGNELPWFGEAPTVPASRNPPSQFRILLSHSPDQIYLATLEDFDLMLAGHNHGGQIRLPWLGALIAPSWHGPRYASGLFHEPPTMMHVSRGVSAKHSIRINCPPEIALLVLTK